MELAVSHSREQESPIEKARWFQSLSLTERMELLCWFTEMILSANPQIVEQRDAEPVAGRVLVLEKA